MDHDPVIVFASFHPDTGKSDELHELLVWMVERTRAEPGCERYDLYRLRDEESGGSFHLFERYESPAALEEHRASKHYVEYRARVGDLLADPIGVLVLEGVDVAP